MEKVKRKTMLYKTGVEYGDYTINHIIGCTHGCKFPCYAYMMAHRFGKAKTMNDWCNPVLVDNYMEILKKELPKKHDKIKSVQLCFSTDPFMYNREDLHESTIEIIKLLNSYNIPCYILTKGILPKKLIELNKMNYYGITLVSLNEDYRKEMEPGAAPIKDRLEALKYLKENGCNTWISMEPYPTPNICEQDLVELLNECKFVNKIIFGRLHYNKRVSGYKEYKKFYNECAEKVKHFCDKNNIDCHIKNKTITE